MAILCECEYVNMPKLLSSLYNQQANLNFYPPL